jgi:hypothetical protein
LSRGDGAITPALGLAPVPEVSPGDIDGIALDMLMFDKIDIFICSPFFGFGLVELVCLFLRENFLKKVFSRSFKNFWHFNVGIWPDRGLCKTVGQWALRKFHGKQNDRFWRNRREISRLRSK